MTNELGREPAWLKDLRVVQSRIEGLYKAFEGTDLSHGMILFLEPDSVGDISDPRFYGTRDSLVESFFHEFDFGGKLVHFLYAEHGDADKARDLLQGLSSNLKNISSILSAVPRKTLPAIPTTTFGNGNKDRMAHWCSTLQHLGRLPSSHSFLIETEFGSPNPESYGRTLFSPWDESSSIAQYDAMEFMLYECHQAKLVPGWMERFQAEGQKFPEAIASSLTKPVLYASLNGIDRIISLYKSDRVVREAPFIPKLSEEDLSKAQLFVLLGMIKHHGVGTDAPNYEYPSQNELAKISKVRQGTISKAVVTIMKLMDCHPGLAGVAKYKELCRQEMISAELEKLTVKTVGWNRRQIDFDSLEGYKSDNWE